MGKCKDLPNLTDRQNEILAGWLLSDGSMIRPAGINYNSSFRLSQSKYPTNKPERTEAIQWTFNELLPFSSYINERFRYDKRDRKSITHVGMFSCAHPVLTSIRYKWYDDIKRVPRDLKLTPLTTAIWAMGDGTNNVFNRRFVFCTDSFLKEDVEFLISVLKRDVGVDSSRVPCNNRIGIYNNYNYLKLIEYIKPHMLSCFSYKCNLDEYTEPLVGDKRSFVKIKQTEGHVDWIVNKREEGLTTEEIACEFTKQFGIDIGFGAICRKLKKLQDVKVSLNVGRKLKDESIKKSLNVRLLSHYNDGFKGVEHKNGKFVAGICKEYKSYQLGSFDTAEEAAKNVDYHAINFLGKDNTYLNFPDFDYANFVPRRSHDAVFNRKIGKINSNKEQFEKDCKNMSINELAIKYEVTSVAIRYWIKKLQSTKVEE